MVGRSCSGHGFRGHVVRFHEQWTFVVFHDFDANGFVFRLVFDALPYQVGIGGFCRWRFVEVLNVGGVGEEKDVGIFRKFLHRLAHQGEHHSEFCRVQVADHIAADDMAVVLYHNGCTPCTLLMSIVA